MRCPVCEKDIYIPYLEIFDDRYSEPNIYKLMRCQNCLHIFLQAQDSKRMT